MKTMIVVACAAAACGGKKPATTSAGDAASHVAEVAASDAPPPPPGTPHPTEILFKNGDTTIAGTYWAPAATTTACAVFVHQLSSTRNEWKPVIDRLRGRAHLYAIDMRGHGGSTGGPKGWQDFTTADWEKVETDVGGAVDKLIAKGAGPECVLVGASIGSSAVLRYAASAPEHTRAVVLLSPGLNYRELATPPAAHKITKPVLLVHSQEDGANDSATALVDIWHDAKVPVDVIADPGTAHGMKIVAGDPKVLDQVVAFIAKQLGV